MQAAGVIASNDVPCQCCREQTQWRASIYYFCVAGWRMQLLEYLLIRCEARGHSRLFHRTLHAFDLVVSSRRHRISQDSHPWPGLRQGVLCFLPGAAHDVVGERGERDQAGFASQLQSQADEIHAPEQTTRRNTGFHSMGARTNLAGLAALPCCTPRSLSRACSHGPPAFSPARSPEFLVQIRP